MDQSEGFVCHLDAMDEQQRARHLEVTTSLGQMPLETRELENGYGFCYPAEAVLLAAEFISRERLCCPFFNFKLELTADNGPLWLTLTGREGVKAFLEAEFATSG